MGKRRHPRVELRVPVRIFGTDANGRPFSENVFTLNISEGGALLGEVTSQLKVEEIIGLVYEQKKGRFQVRWIGDAGSASSGHVGLCSLAGQPVLWNVPLPATGEDGFFSRPKDRRRHSRLKYAGSVELHPQDAAVVWGKTSDISLGGCFVEMAIPLAKETPLRVGLWVGENKIWILARVVSSTPGFGIGLQFAEMSDKDAEALKLLLTKIAPSF
jgi:hypothetical protein